MPYPAEQLIAALREDAWRECALPDGTNPEIEQRVAQAQTKRHRALELANAAFIYADHEQYELAAERMQQARTASPRTIRQRAVDRMQMLCDVAGAFKRLAPPSRDCDPLPSVHDIRR